MARYELVGLLFLKNRENVAQIFEYIVSERTFLTHIFGSGGVSGTTYFQMRVGGQLQIIFGVLEIHYLRTTNIEIRVFQKTFSI